DHLSRAWWLSLYPGLAILATVLSYNLLGEGLREAFNPHSESRSS
ncbi:MAG: peptide ABC transporter permease, partial [Deltaproteobacteria bacterium]|nr:peptide ABC transporter permease [Deltaproteobacteria bacterium]